MNRSFSLRRAASARPHPVFPCRVLLGAVLLAFGGLAPVQADDGLVVVGYGGAGQKAQEVAFFQPFTQQTGIPVVQSEYNGEMARIKVMADTGHADWDLVQVEGPDLARGCDDGLFERLDWQAIGGKQQLIANAAQECGSAALVWGVAIGYDADRLQQPPASWADFWDVQRFPGKRGLRKRAIYNLEFALLADGVPREQVYPLLATRADAHRAGRNLALVWPGSLYGMDYWAVVKGSKRGAEARRFIAFANAPDAQVRYVENIPYGPTNRQAAQRLPAQLASWVPTAPANLEQGLAMDDEFWVEHGEELEERFNAWASQ
ncbi:TPA: extracellular solute-binding protein [Pseudomonas aeruginosa]|nr:extracellular solute-binding protein [Pseudomonas aeruginosa]